MRRCWEREWGKDWQKVIDITLLYGKVFDLYIGTPSTLYCRRAKKIMRISGLLSFYFRSCIVTSGCGIYADGLFLSTLSTCY